MNDNAYIIELTQADVNLIRSALRRMFENDALRSEEGMSFSELRTRRSTDKLFDRLPATRVLNDAEILILNTSLGLVP